MTPAVTAKVRPQLEGLKRSLPHALLLTGPEGVGLSTIARALSEERQLLRVVRPELLTKTSTIPQIGVETVRELYNETKGKSNAAQTIIIDDGDKMTPAAQNSFLKLLEEPTATVHFILTSHRPEKLLPTVRSRVQTYYLPPLTERETMDFLADATLDEKKRQQLLFVAQGLPAELVRLQEDETYFASTAERMKKARQLLEADSYGRIALLSSSKMDRSEALELIKAALSLLSRRPSAETSVLLSRLLDVYDAVERGGNIRLQMTAAVV